MCVCVCVCVRVSMWLQAVNARERELLAEVQAQQSLRQSTVDEGLHTCEQTWRALTQLQAAVSSEAGQSANDQEFLLEFNTQLTLLRCGGCAGEVRCGAAEVRERIPTS